MSLDVQNYRVQVLLERIKPQVQSAHVQVLLTEELLPQPSAPSYPAFVWTGKSWRPMAGTSQQGTQGVSAFVPTAKYRDDGDILVTLNGQLTYIPLEHDHDEDYEPLGAIEQLRAESMVVVAHGSDPEHPRPTGVGAVYWIGSEEPVNAIDADLWYDTDTT